MNYSTIRNACFTIILSLISLPSFAWNHSIELGYGQSHDPNDTKYTNSGFLLSGDIFPLKRSPLVFWSITGSLGQLHSTAPVNKNVTTGAASLALRLYMFNIKHTFPAYFLASAGPAYLSSRKFGTNTQAGHLSIQTNLGLGVEWHHIDTNLRLLHYSNAGLGHPNEGYNVLYLFSLGYLF